MKAAETVEPRVGATAACTALDIPRATYYRWKNPSHRQTNPAKRMTPLALTSDERQEVLTALHAEEYVDRAPAAVYSALLDRGTYLCSVRTMYRILESEGENRERRRQRKHPQYAKPELLATQPNQLWSWDITKLKGPVKWTYFYLYTILDVFSRYVVGWMVSSKETGKLAKQLIAETCRKYNITPDQLVIHADRGSSMTSKTVALLMADLGVTKSHSRPYTSNDNPYSEAQFKTLKYRPDFPERFGSVQHSRAHCGDFFHWYNTIHYHSGIAMLTPEMVHFGMAQDILKNRNDVLLKAAADHPLRFKNKPPVPHQLPSEVWINPPESQKDSLI